MVIYYQYIFPFVKIILNMFIYLECGRGTVWTKVHLDGCEKGKIH